MEEIEAFKVVLEARVKIYAKREKMKGKVNILKSLFWTFFFTLIPVICFWKPVDWIHPVGSEASESLQLSGGDHEMA